MLPSQELFGFPIRLYDPIELEQDQLVEDLTNNVERYVRQYVVGWKKLPIESIIEYNSSFTKGKTLDEVKRDGLDVTIIDTDKESYLCDWPLQKFEKEYNKHFKKLLRSIDKERAAEPEFQEITEEELLAYINQKK